MIVSELSRIIDHLVAVGTNLVDMGALTIYWYTYNVRESIYQIIEKLCGSRLTTNYARIGGLSHDLYPGFAAEVHAKLAELATGVGDTLKLVARNRIFLDRTIGVGRISREDALSHGFTGPCLRACGIPYDVRKAHPYLGYEDYDFEVPTATEGDTYARILVRLQEIVQSQRIIEQALQRLPGGPVNVDDAARDPAAQGRGLRQHRGRHEPVQADLRGDQGAGRRGLRLRRGRQRRAGLLLRGGRHRAGPTASRCARRASRSSRAFTDMIVGGMISDAVATLGSINIIAGELDR